jgi:hypothetical protein
MTPPAAFPNRGPGHLARPPRGPRADTRVGRGLLGGVSGRTIDADSVSGILRGLKGGRGTVIPQNGVSLQRGGREPP